MENKHFWGNEKAAIFSTDIDIFLYRTEYKTFFKKTKHYNNIISLFKFNIYKKEIKITDAVT